MKKIFRKKLLRKPPQKKPRIFLDQKKMAVACACVCAACVLLLALAALFSKRQGTQYQAFPQLVELQNEGENVFKGEDDFSKTQIVQKEISSSENFLEKNSQEEIQSKKNQATKIQSNENSSKKNSQNEIQSNENLLSKNDLPQNSPKKTGFDFLPAKNNAVLCVVFDDAGQNVEQLKKCVSLPFPVTVAVLPRLSHSAQSAQIVRQSGNEVILHQPMQAENLSVNPGAGAIFPEMSETEIAAVLSKNIAEVAPISGINNHEGSLVTEDAASVERILQTISERGIYFLDSRTTSKTQIPSVSKKMNFQYYQRDIFLDNEKTRKNILEQIRRGTEIANRQGFAIMIGHVWSAEILPALLAEAYPELLQKGYRFSTISNSGAERK